METEVNSYLSSLEADPAYSKSTRLAYANDLRVFLRYLDEQKEHSPGWFALGTRNVAKFLESELQRGWSRNTIIRRLAVLKNFQDYLIQEGKLAGANFSAGDDEIQRVIKTMPENTPAPCLSDEQVRSLLALMVASSRPRAPRDRAIFMLLLETGLSVADLTALDMTDLDLNAGRFHVYLEWIGDVWMDLGEAAGPVEDYLRESRPNLLLKPGEPALFISQMNGRLSRQGVWQILKYWGRKTKPPIPISPRLVRHSAVLRMKNAGLSTEDIQMRLGHRNPLSTQALIRRLEKECQHSVQAQSP